MPYLFSFMMSGLLGRFLSLPGADWFCCAGTTWPATKATKATKRRNFFIYFFHGFIWQRLRPWFVFRYSKRTCLFGEENSEKWFVQFVFIHAPCVTFQQKWSWVDGFGLDDLDSCLTHWSFSESMERRLVELE